MLYSPATGGFYDHGIHGDAIPADAVEITAEEHAALMAAQAEGRVITAGADGRPVAGDPPPPSAGQRAAAARAQRDALLAGSDWLVARHRDQRDAGGETTLTAGQYAELLAWRQALRDWPEQPGWPGLPLPAAPAWMEAG